MAKYSERYLALMGRAPKRVPNWEHWSCPDAESYITGMDYYEHPRQVRLKMNELYPDLRLPVPPTDAPVPRPIAGDAVVTDAQGGRVVRWGEGVTGTWDHGETLFKTPEDVFNFSPLAQGDFSRFPVVESQDFRDEEAIYRRYRAQFPAEWGEAPDGSTAAVWYYNTMFMWPMLTFGWELFLECCLDERFERIMDEFAELNRRAYRAFARLPVNFIESHDDIVNARGPVCSPEWMKKYIFPRYEEFWGIVRASGKRVLFVADGCVDRYADDVFACGASGIVTEPYTDFRAIAKRHKDCVLAGEGDNRVLMRGDPAEIEAMVDRMAETAKLSGGYFFCCGNHIPWNVPPESVKRYLDLCRDKAGRAR